MSKLYLNEKEVSEMTGISRSTLQHYRWKGGGPKFIKLGGSVRYPVNELESFLQSYPLLSSTSQNQKGGK